jgi:hypothetical protein
VLAGAGGGVGVEVEAAYALVEVMYTDLADRSALDGMTDMFGSVESSIIVSDCNRS